MRPALANLYLVIGISSGLESSRAIPKSRPSRRPRPRRWTRCISSARSSLSTRTLPRAIYNTSTMLHYFMPVMVSSTAMRNGWCRLGPHIIVAHWCARPQFDRNILMIFFLLGDTYFDFGSVIPSTLGRPRRRYSGDGTISMEVCLQRTRSFHWDLLCVALGKVAKERDFDGVLVRGARAEDPSLHPREKMWKSQGW